MPEQNLAADECERILKDIKIPAQPEVLIDFNNERQREDPDLQKISEIVASDTAISVGILKMVNSAFFGLRQPVGSIQQAVSLLGLNTVSNLVLGLALGNTLSRQRTSFIIKFWTQSNTIALLAAKIARDFTRITSDEAYTLGLMCDCAVPLIAERFPGYEEFYLNNTGTLERSITEMENQRFTTDHALIGALLARSWNLPETIALGIEAHHSREPEMVLDAAENPRMQLEFHSILLFAHHVYNHSMALRYRDLADGPEWELRGGRALETLNIDLGSLAEIKSEYHTLLESV